MRARAVIVSSLLVVTVLFGSASVASAQTPEKQTEIAKCVQEALDQGTDAGECVKANSPIIPDATDLFYGGLAFVILLLAMWKFALPSVQKGMDGRSERIRADLARAEEARTEAEELLATYQRQVAESKGEATRIIEDARATADGLRAELHRRAEAEVAEMRQRAAADVEASKAQALADLTGEVASLAIGAAEVVVQKNLDHPTQVQLIENYITQVGSTN